MKEFLTRFNLTLIISCYVVLVVMLYPQLNIYIVLFGSACMGWRVGHYYGKLKLIPRFLLNFISIIISIAVVKILYPLGLFSILLHLIFLGFSLKFLELKAIRDVYFFVNTGFILVALFLIFNTSITAVFIASLIVLLLLSILMSLHGHALLKKQFIQLLFKSFVFSLPLAMLLFVVIPRLPSLWKMPIQKQATTGLSDSVSPGEIAKLSRSSALAFRATFNNEIPQDSQRYWRVMSLDFFDGITWSQSKNKKLLESQAKRGIGLNILPLDSKIKPSNAYELIMEPNFNHWVPVLDFAATPKNLISLDDFSLRTKNAIARRTVFHISTIDKVNVDSIDAAQRKRLTQLPQFRKGQGNLKTDKWIEQLLQSGMSKGEVLKQLLQRFASNFRYTLSPPTLGENHIDDFLFSTQAGFCVHYASSFLYVARRLGYPARMVTGYLGGEWQDSENFFTVRQYDAHAWVEIWQNDQWQRIDPTAYVSPERVESGLEAGLTDRNEFLENEYLSLQKWQSIALLNTLRDRLIQIDYLWARYVVNFDNQKQIKLLKYWLTKLPWLNITYLILLAMGTILCLLLLLIFKPWVKQKISAEDKIFLSLQSYYSKKGVIREKGQTIGGYCELLYLYNPSNEALLNHFANRYNDLKYQPGLDIFKRKKYIKQLRMLSKHLKN